LENELVVVCAIAFSLLGLVGSQGCEEALDTLGEAIVYDALVLQRLNLVLAVVAFLVYLRLFGADEGLLVNVGVHLYVTVVRELKSVL
jgi:hypothetical protein